MGCADVVPGVSGGTVALIVGIYPRLVGAIAAFDHHTLKLVLAGRLREAAERVDLRFLCALGFGIASAIVSLAKLMTFLLLNHPVPTWSLFFGLILGSVWMVAGMTPKWRGEEWAVFAGGVIFAYLLVGIAPREGAHDFLTLFLTGMIAICAMILPGISGSFLLVILGQYLYVIQAIHDRNLPVIVVFGGGCALGLILFSKVLKWFLARYEAPTMVFLCGLMAGSLRKIWPWKVDLPGQELLKAKHRLQMNVLPEAFDAQVWLALGLAVAGIVLVLAVERWAAKKSAKA